MRALVGTGRHLFVAFIGRSSCCTDAAKTLSTLLSVDQSGTLAHIKMPVADPEPEEVEKVIAFFLTC